MAKKNNSVTSMLEKNHKRTNLVFLGIGLTLFIMNITAFMIYVKDMQYDMGLFNMAVFSSMIVVLIAVYYMTEK